MEEASLCKVDCYGILKGLIGEGLSGNELMLSFRAQYLQIEPSCFCDYIVRDLLEEGKTGEDFLQSFLEKQKLVRQGYELVYGEAANQKR